MPNAKNSRIIRKTHRYLGLFIGIQFLLWTASGLYFSWTDIDEIHGDHFRAPVKTVSHVGVLSLQKISPKLGIHSLQLKTIIDRPYFWVNDNLLIDARTGQIVNGVSEQQALQIAASRMRSDLQLESVRLLEEVDDKHEYRGRPLPVYQMNYQHRDNVTAYVSQADGAFQRVRHRYWRWFDFLWMTHVMDYDARDNINNWLLRAFSILGLVTVFSGFLLWFISSNRVRRAVRFFNQSNI
jgi:hypothetical protein